MVSLPTDMPPHRPVPRPTGNHGPQTPVAENPPFVLDGMNLGREKTPEWGPEIWARIDQAAVNEIDRACVATQFLPKVPSLTPSVRTVPANRIADDNGELSIDQTRVIPLLEASQQFFLSKEQYFEEATIGTAATLASRAANRLARAMDTAIFSGQQSESLVAVAAEQHTVSVALLEDGTPGVYGENVFAAVAEAYAHLQGLNLYGPYALVLPPEQYADAHAPLRSTLIMPADRIRPLMTAGFYASGTLPEKRGVMVSLGGTVDVAIAVHGATSFALINPDETRRFRIYERFTVRIKVPPALVLLSFA